MLDYIISYYVRFIVLYYIIFLLNDILLHYIISCTLYYIRLYHTLLNYDVLQYVAFFHFVLCHMM